MIQFVNDLALPPVRSVGGQCWSTITQCWSDAICWKPREGEFPSPWPYESPTQLPMSPPTQYYHHLWDIADQKAQEICHTAEQSGRRIAVLWSGGIDSTFVLISILRNIASQSVRLVIYLNQTSILENIDFFVKHIADRIEYQDIGTLNINKKWLRENICVTGEGGDCIFGRILPQLMSLAKQGRLHTDYRDNINNIVELFSKHHDPAFCSWFVSKINANLANSMYGPHIKNLLGWMWWVQYNFIFESKCLRPLMLFNKNTEAITSPYTKDFIDTTFFADKRFQLWSFTHHGGLFDEDGGFPKEQAKQYIYDYDKNKTYKLYKRKSLSQLPSLPYRFYDRHWVGSNESSININECLEQFSIN